MSQIFITAEALNTFLGAEKDRLTNAGLTPARYAQVIADVNDEIAGNCGGRTLTTVPAAFVHHGCAIARYRLMSEKVTDKIQKDLDLANAYFKDVRKGDVFIAYAPPPDEPVTSSGGVWFVSRPNVFNGKQF